MFVLFSDLVGSLANSVVRDDVDCDVLYRVALVA